MAWVDEITGLYIPVLFILLNMQKLFSLLLAFSYFLHTCSAQQVDTTKKRMFPGKKNAVSTGFAIPIHNFSNTHFAGATLQYSISKYRFGILKKKPVHSIGLTANGGASYFLGKKERVVSHDYRYPPYIHFHLHAGAIYNPKEKINIQLTAGPGVSLYNGTTRFTIGTGLEGNYFFNGNVALSAGLFLMKEHYSDPLYFGALKAKYTF